MSHKTLQIAVAAALLAAPAVHAESRPPMTVKVSDLDLASPKDVDRLYDRVAEAAGEVCGRGPLTTFIVGPPPEFVACRDAVLDATLGQLNAPLVAALREKIEARRGRETR